jgi:hypothetical protein
MSLRLDVQAPPPGLARVLAPHCLTGARLADEVRALTHFEPAAIGVDLDGGRRSARLLLERL